MYAGTIFGFAGLVGTIAGSSALYSSAPFYGALESSCLGAMPSFFGGPNSLPFRHRAILCLRASLHVGANPRIGDRAPQL